MADPLTITATVLGVIGTGLAIAGHLWPRQPHRDASPTLPPADVTRREFDALRDRVDGDALRASSFREEVLMKLARIFERFNIKEHRDRKSD